MHAGDPPQLVDVDLTGARFLELSIDDGGDTSNGDYADWGGGLIYLQARRHGEAGELDVSVRARAADRVGLARRRRASTRRASPAARPGRPFLFRIPATGEAPLTFAAQNLPAGLTLDPSTGIITGAIARDGPHGRRAHASRTRAAAPRARSRSSAATTRSRSRRRSAGIRGTSGARRVDDAKVRAAADAMVSSGPRRARLSVHQHRRRLGRRARRERRAAAERRSSPT